MLRNAGEVKPATRDEVQALNLAARDRLRIAGVLGEDVTVATERGPRDFAAGDRIMFLAVDFR